MKFAKTIGELKRSGYKVLPVKEELRKNVIQKLKNNEVLFPGIIGYDKTVIPAIVNAILSKHDIILLGLRGQAKTKIARMFVNLLDEYIPIIKGCEINDNPYKPLCKRCVDLVKEYGDDVEIEWLPRERRYGEKLATPDVTIADLIGDIDPIKAATQKLYYSHEGVIHWGIIPRTNRGIFVINELPDLQPRIQVGLFNIMQERDIQIRGFNIRIPLDIMIIFTANPEDYTNRGNIITPLKDRIGSQILTHYPRTIEDGIKITEQEAWLNRDSGKKVIIPYYFKEIIEQVAFQARTSEFVDQKSGVSARLTISCMENLISNAERRAIRLNEDVIYPRICDLNFILPGITGASPISIILITLHSKFIGDSSILGDLTISLSIGVSSAILASLIPYGKSTAHIFIFSAISSVTMLTTKSPLSSMFFKVSFLSPSLFLSMEM